MRIGPFGPGELLVIAALVVLLLAPARSRLARHLGARLRSRLATWRLVATYAMGTREQQVRAEREYVRDVMQWRIESVEPCKQERLESIGSRLIFAAGGYEHARFQLIAAPQLNAFALPGGLVLMTEALLDSCEDPAEIAFILGHELGHVMRGHTARRLVVAAVARAIVRPGSPLAVLVDLAHSRRQELEADREAVQLTRLAGFDPSAGLVALTRLANLERRPTMIDFISTHPSSEERRRQLEDLIRP